MRVKAKGFTLVELLVVIGIIAVLISILLPSLGKARENAVRAQCLSNIRQDAIAFQIYATENKGYIPLQMMQGSGGAFYEWPAFFCYGYNFAASPVPTGVYKPYVNYRLSICPYSIHYLDDVNTSSQQMGYGVYIQNDNDAYFRDQQEFQQETTFGPGSIFTYNATGQTWTMYTQKPAHPINVDGVRMSPGSMIMLADTLEDHQSFGNGSGYGAHPWASFTAVPDNIVQAYGWIGGPYNSAIQTLHGNCANVAFYDCHAESLTAKGLRASPGLHTSCTYNKSGKRVITLTKP